MQVEENYEQNASADSRRAITLFIITLTCMAIFYDGELGFLKGILYLTLGVFISSICFALPAKLLSMKYPKHSEFFILSNYGLIIYTTYQTYIFFST